MNQSITLLAPLSPVSRLDPSVNFFWSRFKLASEYKVFKKKFSIEMFSYCEKLSHYFPNPIIKGVMDKLYLIKIFREIDNGSKSLKYFSNIKYKVRANNKIFMTISDFTIFHNFNISIEFC